MRYFRLQWDDGWCHSLIYLQHLAWHKRKKTCQGLYKLVRINSVKFFSSCSDFSIVLVFPLRATTRRPLHLEARMSSICYPRQDSSVCVSDFLAG